MFECIGLGIIITVIGLLAKGIRSKITDIYNYFINDMKGTRYNKIPILSIILLAFYLSILFTIFMIADCSTVSIIVLVAMVIIVSIIWIFITKKYFYDTEPGYIITISITAILTALVIIVGHFLYINNTNINNTTITEDLPTIEKETTVDHILDKEIVNGRYYLYYGHDESDKTKIEVNHEKYYMYRIGNCYIK